MIETKLEKVDTFPKLFTGGKANLKSPDPSKLLGKPKTTPARRKISSDRDSTDTERETNDEIKNKKKVLGGKKFIKKTCFDANSTKQRYPAPMKHQVVEVFKKQALEAASEKKREKENIAGRSPVSCPLNAGEILCEAQASIKTPTSVRGRDLTPNRGSERQPPHLLLWSPRDLRSIFKPSRQEPDRKKGLSQDSFDEEYHPLPGKAAGSPIPREKISLTTTNKKYTYMSPSERKIERTPVPRKRKSRIDAMGKQLTLDQMVVKQRGLEGISVGKLNNSDSSGPQVETGFAVGGGHDTLDLKQ